MNEYGNKVLRCIPILLAKREYDIFCIDSNHQIKYNFFKVEQTPEEYLYFVKETGLYKLLSDKLTGNLIDYVYGVEAGLNSNGRKNRGGHLMEKLVESYIKKAGFIKNKTYFKEMYLSDLESKTGLDLSSLSNAGTTAKRFDYVIITDKCVYACECNFYASGGSKLSETARSYKTLALESKGITNFKFVWFTDGVGWTSARNNLKETFAIAHKNFSSTNEFREITDIYGNTKKVSQFEVSEIVMSRVEEILTLAKEQINLLTNREIQYIILTGGSSCLPQIKMVASEILGDSIVGNIRLVGVRNNKFSSAIGNVIYFINRLKLRGNNYSMVNDEDEALSKKGKAHSNEAMLGKVFGYFLGE